MLPFWWNSLKLCQILKTVKRFQFWHFQQWTSKLDITTFHHSTFIHGRRRCACKTAWMSNVCKEIEKKKENRLRKERKWLKSVEIHISCSYLLHPPIPHLPLPIPSHFSIQNIYKVESRVQGPVLVLAYTLMLISYPKKFTTNWI